MDTERPNGHFLSDGIAIKTMNLIVEIRYKTLSP